MESAFEKLQRDLARDAEQQAEKKAAAAATVAEVQPGLLPLPEAPALSASVVAGIAAGNINFSTSGRMELGAAAQSEVDQHESLLESYEKRKHARNIVVPTDDGQVKLDLRSFGEPICLFGEGPADRRDRLKTLLTDLGPAAQRKRAAEQGGADGKEKEKEKEVWYHAGPPELADLRKEVAGYSLRRARDRLASARLRLSVPDAERNPGTAKLHNQIRQFGNFSSQVGDTRPLTFCQFNPKGDMLATSSNSGLCKLWSVPDCKEVKTLRGHTERVGCVVWHPESGVSQDPAGVNLVSCDASGAVKCWSMESDEAIATLEGHSKRVPRVAYHPNGRHLGTTCYDHSWRFWDMTTQQEVLHQEGHSRPVYAIAFHPDGSLVCTGGEDAFGRIWDLRSGKCVMTMEGHVGKVLGCDFSANGYHVATGSEDHTMRLWDLRQKKSVYTIPSHKGLISHIKYQKQGDLLVSASFDGTAKVWAMPACTQLKELKGHEGKLVAVDISHDTKYIVSASHDRTFKLWATE